MGSSGRVRAALDTGGEGGRLATMARPTQGRELALPFWRVRGHAEVGPFLREEPCEQFDERCDSYGAAWMLARAACGRFPRSQSRGPYWRVCVG